MSVGSPGTRPHGVALFGGAVCDRHHHQASAAQSQHPSVGKVHSGDKKPAWYKQAPSGMISPVVMLPKQRSRIILQTLRFVKSAFPRVVRGNFFRLNNLFILPQGVRYCQIPCCWTCTAVRQYCVPFLVARRVYRTLLLLSNWLQKACICL